MNVPVCWRSHGQKSVTLSTTEAEYVACSEVVKDYLSYNFWNIYK